MTKRNAAPGNTSDNPIIVPKFNGQFFEVTRTLAKRKIETFITSNQNVEFYRSMQNTTIIAL